ncbi:MAG: class I SAM-dependent methyltransferase [Verrucomicrobiales bacterium]|nr:class I SAM-dependent methyltransferase [Verrucomicrobiales bacterium]
MERLPLILHEDDDLLVIDKPAGWNTHAPDPYTGEGVYEWLRHREPRWAGLAILHRLDKVTSGILVFGKSARANRSLAAQFEQHRVGKRYRFLTAQAGPAGARIERAQIARRGDRYAITTGAGGLRAETRFRPGWSVGRWFAVEAEPLTGRTHQIRVQAAAAGFPVLGDALYGGEPHARVCLHATELTLEHPGSGAAVVFRSEPDFELSPRAAIRRAILDPAATEAHRWAHGEADGEPGWFVDRIGDWLLSQFEGPLGEVQTQRLGVWLRESGGAGAMHKQLSRQVRRLAPEQAAAQPVLGRAPDGAFTARENGLVFEFDFGAGYSVGLFFDQRDNRRRLLANYVGAGFPPPLSTDRPARVLNLFAYTCGFSVCAAQAGAQTLSLDLSRNYLDWGRRNFAHNGLDAAAHEFVFGDAFDWLRRFQRKGRQFDVVILDPPTFSTAKRGGRFRAETDYGDLVRAAARVLAPGGVLLACTNAATVSPPVFCGAVESGLHEAGRRIAARHYVPQPPDFPVSPGQPPHLKTLWLAVEQGVNTGARARA